MPDPSEGGSKNRKRKAVTTGHSHLWKRIEVGLPDAEDVEDDKNHYDHQDLQRKARDDLEAQPGEGVGFFLGLEVIDGSNYRVENRNGCQMMFFNDIGVNDNEGDDVKGGPESATRDSAKTSHAKQSKKKQKTVKQREQPDDEQQELTSIDQTEPPTAAKKKKASKKKQNKVKETDKTITKTITPPSSTATTTKTKTESKAQTSKDDVVDPEQITRMQTAWMSQTGGVTLHPELCKSLVRQDFWTPTPIQAGSLPAAIMGRRNLVGAAPTGSGKTLAFLLPIFQSLLEEEDQHRSDDGEDDRNRALKALIVAPTRELAKQIVAECEKLGRRRATLLVGGLAHVKQQRLLSRRPPIIVGTPGRLWEMISSKEYEHLSDLSQIKFLVIDEADRMIQMGSFPQLSSILDAVQLANPMEDDEEGGDEEMALEDDRVFNMDRMLGLPGIPGEARVTMLNDDILRQVDALRGEGKPEIVDAKESDDESEEENTEEFNEAEVDSDEDKLSLPVAPPVNRQTFIFSATLTLPSTNTVKPNKKRRHNFTVGGAISDILDKSHAKGKTKVVDLATHTKGNEIIDKADNKDRKKAKSSKTSGQVSKFQLPPGLVLQQIKCTQKHKDSHLYAYLTTTSAGDGPCLVFCNSIAGVRRVGKTLQTLGLEVRILHAQLQQRARFKAIEKLRNGLNRTVVVATDVAARGIDIPSIRSVVHYDAARSVGTFVHRAGRTARGMGDNASGQSLSLIAPAEDKAHSAVLSALNRRFETVMIDGRLLREAQERVNLASKIVQVSEVERQTSQNNRWFMEQASEAGLEIDDDLLEDGLGTNNREWAKLKDAKSARERLSVLLAQPMQTQRHGKFLSTNSAAPSKVQRTLPD